MRLTGNISVVVKIAIVVLVTSFTNAGDVQFSASVPPATAGDVQLSASVPPATAGDVQLSASAPPVVAVGQQFRLTYTVNAQGSNLRLPDLGTFQLISGPSTSTSSSVQIINGEMTQTRTMTFTYVLRATTAGNFTIGPATITVDQVQHTSNSLTLEVVADDQGRSQVPDRPAQAPGTAPRDTGGEDIYVRILVDRDEVYQGEGILATIKIYSKLDLTGIENVRLPAFSGFYQQDIDIPPLRSLDREVINGEIYGTGILKQTLLFPQRNGEIRIDPFAMDAVVRQRTGRRGSLFDDFFGGTETRRIPVESRPLTLKVKPLPGQRPDGFGGSVGSFSIGSEMQPSETSTNEAVMFRLTISGRGNLQLLQKPEIEFPAAFEVYDPAVRQDISNSTRGQQGSITWEYLVIPRSPGNFRIPPVQFSFFDPSSGTFRNVSSSALDLAVARGSETGSDATIAGNVREDVRIISRDIRHIKTTGIILRQIGDDPFGSFRFYLWFIGPVVIFTVFILLQTKNIRDRADAARMKNRRASRMARRRLKLAGRHLEENNSQQFYDETLRALWGYLSDKLLIPVSELNRQNAKAALAEKNINENDIGQLMDVINKCEFARYAPAASDADKNTIYRNTMQVITSIEQNIRK
jgi:hypothetical protein